jgi:cytochrome c oxidase cbb3-type subunit I/II
VPYEEGYDKTANDDLKAQAQEIAEDIKKELTLLKRNPDAVVAESEVVALIAYLQRLGVDGVAAEK